MTMIDATVFTGPRRARSSSSFHDIQALPPSVGQEIELYVFPPEDCFLLFW